MKMVLKTVLSVLAFTQIAMANVDSNENNENKVSKKLKATVMASEGRYIINFVSNTLSSCSSTLYNVTEQNLVRGFIPEIRYQLSDPVKFEGKIVPAVCRVGLDRAKAFARIGTPTAIYAPEGYSVESVEQIVQSTTVASTDESEIEVSAGYYLVQIDVPADCADDLNFSYGYSYNENGRLESVQVSENGPVEFDIKRAVCMLEDSVAVGVVHIPTGPTMLQTNDGNKLKLSSVDKTVSVNLD